MVELVGLKMQGIRSIGEQPHVIHFLHPLTIIQGPNGTGKTTTIEALNYVTTGALPPGKMQSFIHNNKLANRTRVDALVQLKFKDIRGNMCTATKRMFASNANAKGGKTTTKSDEFTLMITDKLGNEKSLSSKVADFNKEMLNLLGVPKAILEHVIFCHQEESNWPLSEPKELKIRFDAIFEVTKYVKALDNIKKNIKELEIQLRLIDSELPHLEANKQAKANLRLSYDDSRACHDKNKAIISEYLLQKEKIDTQIKELSKDVEMASKAKYKTDMLSSQIQMKKKFLISINADDFNGNREELVFILTETRKEHESSKLLIKERESYIRDSQKTIRKVEEEFQNLVRLSNRAEQYCNQITNTISLKQKELEKYKDMIAEVSPDSNSVENKLDDISILVKKFRSELGFMDGRSFLYEKWENEAAVSKCCPLCERSFSTNMETFDFSKKMQSNRENIPSETISVQKQLRKYEEEEHTLLKIKPFIGIAQNLENYELPKQQQLHQQATEEFCQVKKEKDSKEAELSRLNDNLKSVNESQINIHQNDNRMRLLEDQLRKLDLKMEIEDLQKQLDENQWKGRDQKVLLKENEELSISAANFNNKIQQKYGEQSQIEAKIKEITREMNNPRYADAKKIFLKKLIERSVIMSTIQDLGKFWKVLDDAIISFHQHKMEQINQILRELWVRVYRGNDIETIKIKSQPVSGSEKKKSYDYSVVMTVDQTDIDMRDHCSAGQKVLASILIRIALADVFAGNCPVLALDEPTTNLDSDKVENIGAMLKALLEHRNNDVQNDLQSQTQTQASVNGVNGFTAASQRTLQLLVITHDKRLVHHLYLACRPEYIYGLRKDENGNSIIKQHRCVCDSLEAEDNEEDSFVYS